MGIVTSYIVSWDLIKIKMSKWINKANSLVMLSEQNDYHNIIREQKGKGYQAIIKINTFEYEIQEMTWNVAITEKNEKQYVREIIQLETSFKLQ